MKRTARIIATGAFLYALPASAQMPPPGNDIAFTSFNEVSINKALAPAKIIAVKKTGSGGRTYFEIKIDNFNMILEPLDCKKDAPLQCPVARLNAIVNLPKATGAEAAKRTKMIAKMREFNRKDSFLKAYQSGDRIIAVRYVNAAYGVHMGTVRTEISLFSKTFRSLIADYLRKS